MSEEHILSRQSITMETSNIRPLEYFKPIHVIFLTQLSSL